MLTLYPCISEFSVTLTFRTAVWFSPVTPWQLHRFRVLSRVEPAPLASPQDDGNLPFHFEPPPNGGHLRIVQSDAMRTDYDASKDTYITPMHPPKKTPGGTWERGNQNLFTTRIHKSETIDYGILLSGERTMILDDGEYHLKPGDCVIDLAAWHAWRNINAGTMAFVFIAATFPDDFKPEGK